MGFAAQVEASIGAVVHDDAPASWPVTLLGQVMAGKQQEPDGTVPGLLHFATQAEQQIETQVACWRAFLPEAPLAWEMGGTRAQQAGQQVQEWDAKTKRELPVVALQTSNLLIGVGPA